MEQPLQPSGQAQNVPVKKAWYKKWWVITIAVIMVLGAIGSAGEDSKKVTDNQSTTTVTPVEETKKAEPEKVMEPEKITPEVVVTSAALSKAYSENEVSADAKYKDKLIEVSGKVVSIDNGTFDNEIIIRLSDGQYDFNGLHCYMKESERDKALTMKKGQTVTLIGKGNSATIGSPVLKNCWVK
ncbi:MAG: hypothetical protein E6Q06_04615 [Candidatus Moraniibacteriota bacterium]|nr:MAG: hypothetical protein E6Q06_04615 [Candidatus Moranbacteria bacterium]